MKSFLANDRRPVGNSNFRTEILLASKAILRFFFYSGWIYEIVRSMIILPNPEGDRTRVENAINEEEEEEDSIAWKLRIGAIEERNGSLPGSVDDNI